jgi:phosphate transport system substrate-binding protein
LYPNKKRFTGVIAMMLALALVGAACGDDAETGTDGPTPTGGSTAKYETLKGSIQTDGSSTVAPVMKIAAEDFQDATKKGVTMTVGVSGTGGGFEKFCKGETDISNASRPIKTSTDPAKPAEAQNCEKAGIKYIELQVANDGLSVVVSPKNTWATCLTVAELKKIWAVDGAVSNWKDVRAGFPDKAIKRFGAGSDSGTFDYFTEAVNGTAGSITRDYSPSEDDNVTVTGVSGDDGGVGFFGLSYALENSSKVKLLDIDGGKGCVKPSSATVQDGSYSPLGRPLFIYVKVDSAKRPEVKGFVDYYYENIESIVKEALFVPLTDAQKSKALGNVTAAGL